MGLQNQLHDVSSESIPLLLIASFVAHLSSLFAPRVQATDDGIQLGSGLTGLIVLAEQLKLNRVFSYRHCCAAAGGSDCVVCLCAARDGERVRRLDCRHVFHKECNTHPIFTHPTFNQGKTNYTIILRFNMEGVSTLESAIDALQNVEKQLRLAGDVAGTRKAVTDILRLCYEAKDWKTLNDQILLLSKK